MDLRCTASIAAAKLIRWICRHTGTSGTSLPGKIALKIDPKLLTKLTPMFTVIMVTGTNGKTTTTSIISKVLDENGIKHFTNRSGANLVSGIASAYTDAVSLRGKSDCRIALLEVDEATVDRVSRTMSPNILVVTNFFRDQLDRYGEVYMVMDKVLSGIKRFKDVKLVLNADDSLCASLGISAGEAAQATYFGFEPSETLPTKEDDVSSANYCQFCHTKYEFSYHVLAHLGGFKCPGCGYSRPDAQVTCNKIIELKPRSTAFEATVDGKPLQTEVSLPGLYNVYNALAALACCNLMGLPVENTLKALKGMKSHFGRMEPIEVGNGKKILLILAKNPAGFNQIINYLTGLEDLKSVAFAINDKAQDGKDISWLWDVDFEKLGARAEDIDRFFTSGIRAEDMSVRLKYAGAPTEKITLIKDYAEFIREGLNAAPESGTFYLVSTYTCMMEIRRDLKKSYGLKEIWQ